MPANDGLLTSPNDRRNTATDCSDARLAALSREQLAAMNQVLLMLLRVQTFAELLHQAHGIISAVAEIRGCGYYLLAKEGHLQLKSGVGDFRGFLPDVIPPGSDLFRSIKPTHGFCLASSQPLQPSLFDDGPVCSFFPISPGGEFAGAIATVHAAENGAFVQAICSQIAAAVDLLHIASSQEAEDAARPIAPSDVPRNGGNGSTHEDHLTAREHEVLSLLCDGLGNKEIADRLYISVATCKHHVESIMAKLGTHTRAGVVAVGLRHLSPHPDEKRAS